ncbi:hypothetical protein T11_12864 [Trichinella zimbabwensis]|uniref:Retrovirus-related Pol polyprotein from transposon n=1 Tax=Trichinella zimbabwensis TaxID=268475 RepID=A0A0V1HCJ6_9BILA|nr:hypothetical protein T11_12864 [Trichinella zimbabwensis]
MDWRLIIMCPRLSSAAKLTYLRSFLSCDALEVITCLSSSNADHEVAMERLREEFDRPAEVIRQQISKLLHVLPKDTGLHAHYKYLRRIIDALTALLKNPQPDHLLKPFMIKWDEKIQADETVAANLSKTPLRFMGRGQTKLIE